MGKSINFANVIELEKHIEILLLSNDCVIVPDFGGFMSHKVDARYDEKSETFLPPLRTLGFNPQLRLNDSLLAQSYIEAYDISYPEAIRRIEEEVTELKQHLVNKGEYEMSDIGTIFLNEHGKYEFEPCEAGILTPEYYGLSTFEMSKVEETTTASIAPLKPVSKDPLPDTTPQNSDEKICLSVSMLRNMAAACLLLAAFLLYPAQISNTGNGNRISQSNIDTGIFKKMMPKSVTIGKLPIQKEKLAPKPVIITEKKVERPYYCIVLASQVSVKNAEDFVGRLKKEGFDESQVLQQHGKNTKVIYGHFDTEDAARNALNRLNGNDFFREGWVLEVKPDNNSCTPSV